MTQRRSLVAGVLALVLTVAMACCDAQPVASYATEWEVEWRGGDNRVSVYSVYTTGGSCWMVVNGDSTAITLVSRDSCR